MKKIKKIILILIIIIAVAAVILFAVKVATNNYFKNIVNSTFSGLKENNSTAINEHIDYNKLLSALDENLQTREATAGINIEEGLFKNLDWNIEKIQIENKKTASATVSITNNDYNKIVNNWLNNIVESANAQNSTQITDELYLETLKKCLEINEVETKTTTQNIAIEEVDKTWQIVVDDNLVCGIFPGLEEIE